MRIQRPDLITLQGHQRHRVAIIAHRLHLKHGSLAMRMISDKRQFSCGPVLVKSRIEPVGHLIQF